MLNELKTLNLQRPDIDELVALSVFGKGMRAEYEAHQLEVPQWLDDRTRDISREIRNRTEDARAKRISEIRSRMDALKTATERKAELQAELDKLEGKTPVSA